MSKQQYEVQVVFRITKEMEEDLLLLCKTYGMTRAGVLRNLIAGDADKLKGNPKLQETLEKMKQIELQLKDINEQYQK